jgi:hypothetical protein
MKRFFPIIIIIGLGLCLLLAGFLYRVYFAGIPYQDPTPALSARYAYHAHIASGIGYTGAAFILLGLFAATIRLVVRMLRH